MSYTKTTPFELLDARFGARLNYVVPVAAPTEIMLFLGKSGFQIKADPSAIENFQALKSNIEIYFNGYSRNFGARSDTIHNTFLAAEEFIDTVNNAFKTNLQDYISFYEFEIRAFYHTDKNGYEIFSNLFSDSSDWGLLKEILGSKYSQSVLRLTPSGKDVNNVVWHEITIEPKVSNPKNALNIREICRNPDISVIKEIANKTQATISDIITKVLLKSDHSS